MKVNVKILEHFDTNLELPSYGSVGAAGADIRASFPDKNVLTLAPGERVLIPTGLSFEIPRDFEIQVRPRSGTSLKTTLLVVNSPGTIDSDYRGEVKIIMGNFGDKSVEIHHGDRIAQLVLAPVLQAQFEVVEELAATSRGAGGFGSTGVK